MWTVGLGHDIRAIPELLPCESSGCHTGRVSRVYGNFSYTRGTFASGHVCCGVSPCGQELVSGEIRIFRYEMCGTWVFTVLLPCGGQFLHFPHVSHS